MQSGRTGFQLVIPVGWASSPSIKWDGQSRVLRGTSLPNRFLFRDYSWEPLYVPPKRHGSSKLIARLTPGRKRLQLKRAEPISRVAPGHRECP
jgi:hypothetical protein